MNQVVNNYRPYSLLVTYYCHYRGAGVDRDACRAAENRVVNEMNVRTEFHASEASVEHVRT